MSNTGRESTTGIPGADLEREKIDALAEFAAGVGHELNNPLAIIGGHAQLLLREIEDETQRRSLATIEAQVRRAYEMIADIRLFARPPQPEFRNLDLVELLREICESERPDMDDAGIRLDFEPGERPEIPIRSDPLQLRVVLGALLKNSREALYGGAGSLIRICCDSIGDDDSNPETAVFSVEDDGPGIAPEIRPLVFCPYFSGRQAGRGLGFGLAKAYRIVERLGGVILIEDVRPRGTRFVVRLPETLKNVGF